MTGSRQTTWRPFSLCIDPTVDTRLWVRVLTTNIGPRSRCSDIAMSHQFLDGFHANPFFVKACGKRPSSCTDACAMTVAIS
jgi:hypothetical protein